MSGLDERDASALHYLATRIRQETSGAGPWDAPGLASVLGKLKGRSLAMTAEHIIRHASDPKAKSPGVLLGSFTPAAVTVPTSTVPKREEACRRCGGFKGACPCSRVESFGDDTDPVTPLSKTEAIRAARAALVTAKHTEETQ